MKITTPSTDTARMARSIRWHGRQTLREITNVPRCQDCGRVAHGSAVGIRKTVDGIVGFAGLVSCGRIWLCPVCNAKVMAKRAIEIGAALTWATVEGYSVVWGSLTMRHNAYSSLEHMLEMQRQAWRSVMNSKSWRSTNATRTVDHVHANCASDCERKRDIIDAGKHGRIGYIRAAEITTGDNGWHPHFHPLIFVRGGSALAQQIADDAAREWVYGIEAQGGEARLEGGQQLRVLDARGSYDALAGYVTKSTYEPAKLALETVWSQGKKGRGRVKETVAHWSLLAQADVQGLKYNENTGELGKWWEFEEAVTGHRMIVWSRGLRSFVSLADEQTDEEIAAEEVGDVNDTVCYLTTDGWMKVRDHPTVLMLMLETLENGGWVALRIVLEQYGIEHYTDATNPLDTTFTYSPEQHHDPAPTAHSDWQPGMPVPRTIFTN